METGKMPLKLDDVRHERTVFTNFLRPHTGWKMHDDAIEYFGLQYLDSLVGSIDYRNSHTGLLEPFNVEDAERRAELYDHTLPRVLLARQILEGQYGNLVTLWLSPGADVTAFTKVLSVTLAAHPSYKLAFNSNDDESYTDDCHSAVQWLRGWLQSESVDQQG